MKWLLVEECVSNWSSFMEIDWDKPYVLKCVSEFSKTTLLHYYVYAMVSVEERRDLLKNDEMYEEDEEEREIVEATLQAYAIWESSILVAVQSITCRLSEIR